uniref:Interleukin-12 subunit alpha n=1 Tax=Anser cygnoides TaxID=8845 RepID=A0A8B9D9F9_ANSCY
MAGCSVEVPSWEDALSQLPASLSNRSSCLSQLRLSQRGGSQLHRSQFGTWFFSDAATQLALGVPEHGTLGFECTLEEVDLEDITKDKINTIKACTSEDPRTGNCPVLESSTFDKRKCLRGIYEDLKAYRAELSDQKVLTSIDEMMKALQPGSPGALQPPPSAALTSFKDRMRLCGVLHAFRIRTVTIDRMMNYLSAL